MLYEGKNRNYPAALGRQGVRTNMGCVKIGASIPEQRNRFRSCDNYPFSVHTIVCLMQKIRILMTCPNLLRNYVRSK